MQFEVYSIYGTALVVDATIASSFCFFLARARIGSRRSVFPVRFYVFCFNNLLYMPDSVVNIIMAYYINTTLITTILNIAYLIAVFIFILILSCKLLTCYYQR